MDKRVIAMLLALLTLPGSAQADETQSRASIRKAARELMLTTVRSQHEGESHVSAGRLDRRLRLPACAAPLEAFLPPGGRTLGTSSVGVRCSGPKPWTLYVPVRVSVYRQVVVAKRPLSRGAEIQAADVALEARDAARLRGRYLDALDQALGMRLKRSVRPGALVMPTAIEAPSLVQRGQRVTLVSQSAGLEIRVAAEALANGAAGDLIRVRNSGSDRIVEGTVIAEGVVRVHR